MGHLGRPLRLYFGCHQGPSWPPPLPVLWGILAATSVNATCAYYHSEFSWVTPGGILAATSVNATCAYYHSEFSWVSPGGILDALSDCVLWVPPGGHPGRPLCLYYIWVPPGGILATPSACTIWVTRGGVLAATSVNTGCVYYHSEFSWVSPGGVLDALSSDCTLGATRGHPGHPLCLYYMCAIHNHAWNLVGCHQGASWPPPLSTLPLGVTMGHLGRPLRLWVPPGGVLATPSACTIWVTPGGILAATSVNAACVYYHSEFSWVSPGGILDTLSDCVL
ncbi:hypothetical protein EDD16DRAFT_1522824 [Pisolithus croceorrhizus]|nr:hypothetical protein EDD16DRAFT_1522824 [Pisolithus croceorrhizus]